MTRQPERHIHLECRRQGSGGKFAVVLKLTDSDSIVRSFVLADLAARQAFADEVCGGRPGIDRQDLLDALEQEAARQLSDEGATVSGSLADRLVALVTATEGVELFHCPQGEAYATVPVGDHRETWRISSKAMKEWLSLLSLTNLDKVPGAQALQDAIAALAGRAKFQGRQHPVHLRIAGLDGCVWLDLCDAQWRAVCVSRDGWRVVGAAEVPVKFVRRKGMLPLPAPTRGGSIDDLRPLVNMPEEETWTLAVGWIIGAFHPMGPYGVLSVSGEAGSAKSTVCRLIRGLVDPNLSPLRRMPKSERDVFVGAGNSWVGVYNNMSGLRPELSDALCALATDGGFATRQLYADDEEAIFGARRPVILNGIDDPATRSDLVDRCIALRLGRIEEDRRRTEEELNADYERVRPGVLGAILDAVSCALRNAGSVRLPYLPRMADLTIWVTAAEESLGWEAERFFRAFVGNRAESHVEIVEASPVGPPILELVDGGPFEGTATKLLAALDRQRGDRPAPEGWPTNYSGMSSALRRLAQNLREVGVDVHLPEKGTGRDKRRLIRLEKSGMRRASVAAEGVDRSHADTTRRTDCSGVQPRAAPCGGADRAARAERPFPTQFNRGEDPWRC